MALNFGGGGLFGQEPARKPEKSVAELEKELAVLQERNRNLEEHQKVQRDSYLQLNQQANQQTSLLREQLAQQINRQHPAAIPSAPAAPAPSDNWEDLVNTLAGGGQPTQAASPGAAPISPQAVKQVVRQTILEEVNAAEAHKRAERATLDRLANEFKVKYPDLGTNPKFTAEVDRVFVGLRQQGIPVEQAWGSALHEAAHIHKNYTQRDQGAPAQQPAQGQQSPMAGVLGGAYLFPTGQGGAAPRGGPDAGTILDMRPPGERFKDASTEITETQKEWARRAFGF